MKHRSPHVSVIVLNWNEGTRTAKCLGQVLQWTYPKESLQIVVQDNASSDGSLEIIEKAAIDCRRLGLRIDLRRLPSHPGVTRSFQAALELVAPEAKYVLRLDNDVEMSPPALQALVNYMDDNPNVGVVGPRVFYANDRARLNSGARWVGRFGGGGREEDSGHAIECDVLLGCLMLTRRATIEALGRWFDPELFLFAEEVEFCASIRKLGFKTFYVPEAEVFHDAGTSTGKHVDLSTYLNHRNHTLVMNRVTPGWVSALRNLHLGVRVPLRCLRRQSLVPLIGFWDGMRARKLSEEWWCEAIDSGRFRRP